MSINVPFTKSNVEECLREVAKEYKKRSRGRMPTEIILVGGASVLINYGFRDMSQDIDAMYVADACMKDAINAVGDRFNLPNGWLNDDFTKTASYTPRLREYSQYYKTFCQVFAVRTVRAEYLVAMKLMSGRQYKKDLSDIAGIVYEQKLAGAPLSYEAINKAVCDLYDNWDHISPQAKSLLDKILSCNDLKALFVEISEDEATAKMTIKEVEAKYPKAVRKDNVEQVIAAARRKKEKR